MEVERKNVVTWPADFKAEYDSNPRYTQMTPEVAFNAIRGQLALKSIRQEPKKLNIE